jgi:hypothetical protein
MCKRLDADDKNIGMSSWKRPSAKSIMIFFGIGTSGYLIWKYGGFFKNFAKNIFNPNIYGSMLGKKDEQLRRPTMEEIRNARVKKYDINIEKSE